VTNHYTIDTPEGPKLFVPKDDYDALAAELANHRNEVTYCNGDLAFLRERIRDLEAALAKEKGGWDAFYKLRKSVGEDRLSRHDCRSDNPGPER
jgi:hypothetical protein